MFFIQDYKCDKYDYLIAVACGAIAGIIDIFFIGAPGNSKLAQWSDDTVDKMVVLFAKQQGWEGKRSESISSAIDFLEKKRTVNYDMIQDMAVPGMAASNHHMKSLAHSPDVIGLFFSIVDQFTSSATFVNNGSLVTVHTEPEGDLFLYGDGFIPKLFCGFTNWLIHVMSDIAGSSGSRRKGNYGSGIVIPFYELFGFCKFGKFNVDGEVKNLAELATAAFQTTPNRRSMDFRFGMAMSIPVVLMDLSIRLIWSIRRHYQYSLPIKECLPTNTHSDLRLMLIVGNGTLCVLDGADAAIRSGGNALEFFMRLNLIAWGKLVMMIMKEVCIRLADGKWLGEVKVSKKRMEEMQQLLLTIQEQERKYRAEFTLAFNTLFEGNQEIIDVAFSEMVNTINNCNIDGFIMQVQNIGNAFGIDYTFDTFEKIDAKMSDENYTFDL